MNFTGPAAVGRRGDDVLRGALRVGRLLLLLQLLAVGLRRALGKGLLGLQLGLTLRDHVVRLQGRDREHFCLHTMPPHSNHFNRTA